MRKPISRRDFLKMAAEAERAARQAKPKLRENYREMAKRWRALAESVKASSGSSRT